MPNQFLTNNEIDFNWKYLLREAHKRSYQPEPRSFGNLCEPEKYNAHEESTHRDDFGPKTNYPAMQPISKEEPISTALTSCRVKHLVSTTQQDFDGRKVGTCIVTISTAISSFFKNGHVPGNEFLMQSCQLHPCKSDVNAHRGAPRGDPEVLLTTVGSVPLIKTCPSFQKWETTYQRDFQYDPVLQPNFPFPINY